MQTKNRHYSEHITFPANKMLPKSILKGCKTKATRKNIKKWHTKRSRRFNKHLATKLY